MTLTSHLHRAGVCLLAAFLWCAGSERCLAWSDDAPSDAKAAAKPDSHAASSDGHHAAHGGHDDLSHANAGPNQEKPDDLKFDLAIYTAVVFFLLLALLGKFAWNPICHALEEREKGIERQIEEARVGAERVAEQLKQYEAKLAAATDEARELIAQARRDGESLREQIVGEAKATAQRERERAVADIAVARDMALRDIAQRSVDTAIALASNIVRRELRPQDHQALVRETLDKLPQQN